ncbi:hypothetical protein [Streptomyces sp. NPDC050548]|uniref:hypothetical protein n=1 Tax=Streptomyces sp. NPDC050548 TaxID=3365629 RepID=UPI0037939AE1
MPAPLTMPLPEEPVSGGSEARGTRPVGRTAALLRLLRPRGRALRQEAALSHRLSVDLDGCRKELARWQRHTDSFERELTRVSFERAHLLAWLAALHPSSAAISPAVGGRHLLSLVAGDRQLSWWLLPRDLPLFGHVRRVDHTVHHLRRDGPAALEQAAHIRSHTRLLAMEGALFAAPVRQQPQARPPTER